MTAALRHRTWNWLPTFLAVAETGSIAAASRHLHVTPAAVSRTVRLLEAELGEEVFNRVGRTLVLNTRGTALRDALRTATATVDDGLSRTLGTPFAGDFRVASIGVLTQYFVIPALIQMKNEYDELVPENLNVGVAQSASLLSRGEIDVAFHYERLSVDGIQVEKLGTTSMSVYCGQSHPLFRKRKLVQQDVLDHPFSIPQIGDTGQVMDGWPPTLSRKVGMRITLLKSNLDICLSGTLLTVLPDVAADEFVKAKALRRLSVVTLPEIDVYASRPNSRLERGAESELVARVRKMLG